MLVFAQGNPARRDVCELGAAIPEQLSVMGYVREVG